MNEKAKIIFSSEDLNVDNVFKFEEIGDEITGFYLGNCSIKFKTIQDYIVIRTLEGNKLVNLYADLKSYSGLLVAGRNIRIKLEEKIGIGEGGNRTFYKFNVTIFR